LQGKHQISEFGNTETCHCADGDAWRAWLGSNHETSPGVWLVLAQKGITDPTSLTYDMTLEEHEVLSPSALAEPGGVSG